MGPEALPFFALYHSKEGDGSGYRIECNIKEYQKNDHIDVAKLVQPETGGVS
jgi:hypothetical protein